MHEDATVGRGTSAMCELCVDYFVITSKDRQKRWKEFSFVRRCESGGLFVLLEGLFNKNFREMNL